jgi:hypothetical protein
MNEKQLIFIILFFTVFPFLGKIIFNFVQVDAATTINATTKIVICGNGIKEAGEDCDSSDLSGKGCQSFGYSQGTLSCYPSCDFNLSNCSQTSSNAGNSGNSGGGTGVYTPVSPPETKIVLTGKTYPQSSVVLLKDGQVASKTIAEINGNFNMQLSGLSDATYIFSLYGEDNKATSSSSFVFPVKMIQGETKIIDNIFIAPTITTNKNEVKIGDNITISGQSVPQSDITIIVDSEEEVLNEVKTGDNGNYSFNLDTSLLEKGDYYVKSRASLNEKNSSYSKSIKFIVGDSNVVLPIQTSSKGDVSCDGRVSLVDFSVVAYWYKKPLNQSFSIIEKEKLNGDGKIDLVDFSIVAFYWKG